MIEKKKQLFFVLHELYFGDFEEQIIIEQLNNELIYQSQLYEYMQKIFDLRKLSKQLGVQQLIMNQVAPV